MATLRAFFAVTIALLLCAWGAGFCAAQMIGPDYVISPGDALEVQVFGETDLSKTYPVGPAGSLVMPLIGQVTVGDLTLSQAQQVLTQKLRVILRSPHVTVGLNEVQSGRKVYVLGYVATQGPLLLPFGASVLDALAAAGTTDNSDLRQVQLTHPGRPTVTLDLSGLRTGEAVAVAAPEKVRYGDVVRVPRLEDRIAVLGQVNTPGSTVLPLGAKVSVLDALARVGGGLTKDASLVNAMLVHEDGETTVVNLEALLKRGETGQNVILAAGDALVVQEAENISVVGEVMRPLSFRSTDPVTVLEALAQAGSFTPKADLARAQVVSSNGKARGVDLKALWEKGDLSQNIKLAAGDVLLLPEMAPTNLLVVGAVQWPGVQELANVKQRDVLRIVTAAGTTLQSDLSRVAVYRGEQRMVVDLDAVMQGALDKNLTLEPDDVVMVPEKSVVYVFGTVGRQGKLPWDPKLTVLEALSDAGGLGPRANDNAIQIVRTMADGESEAIPVPFGALKRGEAPENVKLQPGDILYVPSLGERGKTLATLRDLLWGVGVIIGLTR